MQDEAKSGPDAKKIGHNFVKKGESEITADKKLKFLEFVTF